MGTIDSHGLNRCDGLLEQWADLFRSSTPTAEQLLCDAFLRRALDDLSSARYFNGVVEWMIEDTYDFAEPGAIPFNVACAVLNCDPVAVRGRIIAEIQKWRGGGHLFKGRRKRSKGLGKEARV